LLFRDHVVCAARKGHQAVGRMLSVEEFASLEHLVIMPNTVNCFGESVDQALAARSYRRNRRFVTPNYLTAPYLLANSDMVALLPSLLLSRFRDHLGLAEVALPVQVPSLDIYLSWHDRTHRHAAHTWFREQVVQSIELSPQRS
jgi:DNA-binding transcriptional LysR family regulator